MTAIHFPDLSAYQKGISLEGALAAALKATEGTNWLSSDFEPAVLRASNAGAWPFAYHFLRQGNPAGQAEWCYAHVREMPLMLDWEPAGTSRPSLADARSFIDEYRELGGHVYALYHPNWYWQQIGKPSLQAFIDRKMSLWSSNYVAYTEDGPGWLPYGGMTPRIWQWTSSRLFNGQPVDFNAFKGTLHELQELISGGPVPEQPSAPAPQFPYPQNHYLGEPSPSPFCHSGYYGGRDHANVHTWQARMVQRGWALTLDGCFGPQSYNVARLFQREKGLAVDGKVGRDTWTATWLAPVT